jgi:HAD superfamily hydrolase (TIGR01509 family)
MEYSTQHGRTLDADTWAQVQGVVFDAFGTLVTKSRRLDPVRRLVDLATPARRQAVLARITREAKGWDDWVADLELDPAHPALAGLRADLATEAASVQARSAALAFWPQVAASGKKLALCSNLVEPYVAPCQRALPGRMDALIWSCHAGWAKPDPAIYLAAAQALHLPPHAILFVGDRQLEDVDGPRAVGMRSVLVGGFEAFCAANR